MSLEITLELSDTDLEHFRAVMEKAKNSAQNLGEQEIVENARALLAQVRQSDAPGFIRSRMNLLETMIGMVVDKGWALDGKDSERVVQALAYFSEPEDLIPDDIPGLGFLDDAIMIDLVSSELEHEIAAYRDFCVFRAAEAGRRGDDNASALQRGDWLEERRAQLHSRMRRRRRRARGGGSSSSPLSMI